MSASTNIQRRSSRRRTSSLLVTFVAALLAAIGLLMIVVESTDAQTQGEVWAWGGNELGALGDGTNTDSNTPVQVSDLSDVQAVAGGGLFSMALKDDGSVWAWGSNAVGQLGDGAFNQSNTPVQVSGLSGVQAIAAGESYSLALKNDGSVWAWGTNEEGQLGDGTNTQSNTPVQVSDLSDVQAIDGGGIHSMALKNDGSVWVWGYPENSNIPVQVSGLSGVQAIAAGYVHSLAIGSFEPDTTPPEVSSTIPENNATGVSTTAPITATFSEDVDVPSGNSWFTVKSVRTGTLVSGQLSYDANTKTATFQGTLNRGDAYKATITTEVKDKAGNALAQPYTWQFTTAGPKPKQ